MDQDRTEIEAVIQTYFDGLYEGDADKLASVFTPSCDLAWEQDGKLAEWSRDHWLGVVRGRASAQAEGLPRGDEILMIDQSSTTSAFVKLRCQLPPRYFTDYLSLLKVDGRWQIAQKVFAVRMGEAATG